MRKVSSFVIIGAVLSIDLASAEPAKKLAIDALSDSLSYMSVSQIMDCSIVSNAMSEALPQFKPQADMWNALFLRRSAEGNVDVERLKAGSTLLQDRKNAPGVSNADRKAQLNVMQGCMVKLLKATDQSVLKIASEHDLKVRAQR